MYQQISSSEKKTGNVRKTKIGSSTKGVVNWGYCLGKKGEPLLSYRYRMGQGELESFLLINWDTSFGYLEAVLDAVVC